MEEAEDEDHDPAGGENGNDGGHASQKGLDDLANVRVLYGARFANRGDRIVRVLGHCGAGGVNTLLGDLTT